MAIKFYDAVADTGGALGVEIPSGIKGVLLPKVSSTDRATGITVHRKFYIESDETIGLTVGLNGDGLFSACLIQGTGDAQVVGDLTGSEDKFGGGYITQLEDSLGATETVNGVGGLIDIKKVTVADDVTGDSYFRAGDRFHIDTNIYIIQSVTPVAGGSEITLASNATYYYAIGKWGYSNLSDTITVDTHNSYWLKITVQANTITPIEYSAFAIVTVY